MLPSGRGGEACVVSLSISPVEERRKPMTESTSGARTTPLCVRPARVALSASGIELSGAFHFAGRTRFAHSQATK